MLIIMHIVSCHNTLLTLSTFTYVYNTAIDATINNNIVYGFHFLFKSGHLLHHNEHNSVHYICHDIKQAMSYHTMKFYVMTCHSYACHDSIVGSLMNM